MDSAHLLIVLAAFIGFLMAWGVGANDVANAMGTSVGSKSLTIRQAILIATVFEFLGALLAGGAVTDTLRKGLIDPTSLVGQPELFVIGMLAALTATGLWLAVATRFGWPVSTSHTIVGAIIGFGVVNLGPQTIQWHKLGHIGLSWLFSPILGAFLAFALFWSQRKLILDHRAPIQQARRIIPIYLFIVSLIVTAMTFTTGLDYLGIKLSPQQSWLCALCLALLFTLLGNKCLQKVRLDPQADQQFHFANVEKQFSILMVFTACAMAFAHGSNDVANAIGPVAAIADVALTGELSQHTTIPLWVSLMGALGIVFGLVTYGHKVIGTVGSGITELTPSRGFAATLAAAATVVLASATGLPISTTHTLVGAVLGVGLAKGISALNLKVIRNILLSWLITLPAGAILAIFFFKVYQLILPI